MLDEGADGSQQTTPAAIPPTPESALNLRCNCPHCQTPPPKPTQLPFPATEVNFRSSTFNTCEHQHLPLMAGVTMRHMVNANAEPVAHPTPITVPLHWQSDVKAGLNHDVLLGVLEPVPVGKAVTWCHCMVICAKKNGKPRQAVDIQALNLHATQETYHTHNPFHQACSVPGGTKKTVFDYWNSYHSVPIHPDDHHLTTFITPWG